MKAVTLLAVVVAPLAIVLHGCTDLKESPLSAITPDNFYKNEAEVKSGLAAVYSSLGATVNAYYNLSQISTDENIVPIRGQDWKDNGRWLEIHRQTWGANSPSGLDDINGAWVDLFTGVARANVVLNALKGVTVPNQKVMEGELRTLRAFYYYLLMDMFGGVPIVTTSDVKPRARNTRAEVFKFVESELLAAREGLPPSWDAANQGRLTKGAADAILANMYVNAQVFTGTVTASGLQPGPARWQDAVTVADRILNSGVYTLAVGDSNAWRSNFTADNHQSLENIFVFKRMHQDGLGLNFLNRALHYSQMAPSPWNGFSTLAETYYAFDQADQRRKIFLVGPQINFDTGLPAKDRTGQPLVFTPVIANIESATEGEGARIYKWPIDPKHVGPDQGNDYPLFRLAEIYLIKAEAMNELGNTAAALDLVNTLRARVFFPPKPLIGPFTQDGFRTQLVNERLFELTAEAKRRQDLIRFGLYTTKPWAFRPLPSAAYRILMPIPQTQLQSNPMLAQNPGY
ncbi:MAG: RagB/SusD family nutrient uptake outer membrane protein [Gemmatimonadaceae bacterium]